ncbi:lysophospholipid acyltransferase family protein [Peristeroidobacter agariperforans]|uniref:lysophospholipid acyltransferase family protein n=1 Tax=Peristeroidobacter agariperforans TaxID=268404 RepID=UPI00101D1A45|nr:lysophospholipid acyltransferase family protein [Peristeroidobacter agariperforans]
MRPSSFLLTGVAKLLVGAFPRWMGCAPEATQRIYFANHTSHIDTVAIWAALPIRLRNITHPVAAKDYWGGGVRRYIATKMLRAVLIDRSRSDPNANPLAPLIEMLQLGESLIIFPEGTRGASAVPGPFKSGLYHLATQFPSAQLVPVYLENLHRSLPKGAILPIPMTCTVRFGAPMALSADETKEAFLERARGEVVRLAGNVKA